MTNANDMLAAMRAFDKALDGEGRNYLNLDEILRNRPVVEMLQKQVESNISSDYLPGFTFPNITKFLWHLKNEQFLRRYLFGEAIPPKHFVDHWIRRFIIPDKYQYLYEVTLALRTRAAESRDLRSRVDIKRPYVSWLKIMREWMQINDCDRGYDVPQRYANPWSVVYKKLADQTIYTWANKAQSSRNKRQHQSPYNGWYIDSVFYMGGQLINVEAASNSVAMTNTEYSETWKWHPKPNSPSPKRSRLSFMFPAAVDTWKSPDRKFHPSFF